MRLLTNNKHRQMDGAAILVTVIAFAFAALAPMNAVGQDPSERKATTTAGAAGGWTWDYEGFGGRQAKDSLTLSVDGTGLTGEHQGAFGSTKIEDGKIDGSAISFSVSRTFGDRTMTTKYSGKLDGDKILGSIEVEGFNDTREIDWKAYRNPEIDPSGLWVWTSAGRDGSERKSWIKLKYDKGSLAGTYLTERSQAPIQKATLNGKAIKFEVARRGWGGTTQERITSYSGELSEKGITGSITMKRQDEDRTVDWAASREAVTGDPLGTWTWNQRGRDGDVENKVTIRKDDSGALLGKYTRNDDSSDLEEVKLDGDVLSFKATRETGQGSFSSKYSAKIDDDSLAGTISGTRGERTWSFPFSATRQLPKAEPVGSWVWTTRRFSRDGAGGETKNTLALKSVDGKLSGSYSDGDQSSGIEDAKLVGNTVSFNIEREFGDRKMKVRYDGLIRGDVIKGTSRYISADESAESAANQWATRWEAKRE